jgi:hypothetical protein
LLDVSWSPCRRSHPAGGAPSRQPDCDEPCCLHQLGTCSASGPRHCRGLPLRLLTLRPGNSLTILTMAWSMSFSGSVSLPPAIQATGRLALAPAGLPPAEHVCLSGHHAEPCASLCTAKAPPTTGRPAPRPHLARGWARRAPATARPRRAAPGTPTRSGATPSWTPRRRRRAGADRGECPAGTTLAAGLARPQ